MKNTQLSAIALVATLTATSASAVLGPIPIYLNSEYRTDSPAIGSIHSTLSFSADDIVATGANTLLDFLESVPSAGLFNPQGNIPAVFIRGNEARHTLVLIDGVSVNDISSPDGAVGYGLKNIALNDIEKIEIIKGSGAVLYGSSAIAGVIAITTKKGADGEKTSVNLKLGSHNSKSYTLSASSGNEDGFIRLTSNKHTSNGINAREDDSSGETDGIDNQTIQVKLGNQHFDLSYLESANKTEYDKCGFPNTNNCLADRKLSKIALNAGKKLSSNWNAKLSLSQAKTDVSTYENGVVSPFSSDDYKSTNITLRNDIKIGDALLNIGLSKIDDENITKKQKFTSKDLFINWQKNLGNVDINTGARHIKHEEFGSKSIYNLGISKSINSLKFIANYSTAFNAPSLYQSNNKATAKLKPETAKNIELGLEKQHSWGNSSVRLYKNKVSNLIDYVSCSGGSNATYPPPTFTPTCPAGETYIPGYKNQDRLKTEGVELSVNANIAGYLFDFSHNYNKSRKNDETTQSLRRPKNTSNLTVNKKYGKFNSRIQVIKKSSSLDGVRLDGYILVNLSSDYEINKSVKIALNIKNATDKNYNIANKYNQLGRTLEVGLNYQF
ncbi:MAG: TonB-dependent receptor [Candidatus Thioglobus sp.]|nr:MAG: TonB-dependent receptor [Candidatus Thioglobus sp.]KAA0453506.1 MAG: TonB-dependent receptor [Candidatus Thioglobus sp.]